MKTIVRTCTFAIILTFKINYCFSQSLYFKAGGAFHLPIITHESPDLFSLYVAIPGLGNIGVNQKNNKFSLAKGLGINGSIGHSLNDRISVELGMSYYSNTKKDFVADIPFPFTFPCTTSWTFKNYSLQPTIIYGQTFNRSTFNINFNGGIGFSSLRANLTLDDHRYCGYSFSKFMSLSYGCGLEYLYKVSSSLQVYLSSGISNIYYTPRHASLTSYPSPISNLEPYEKEIDYVNEVNNSPYVDPNKPEERLKNTLKINSIFFGLGFKYTLSKKNNPTKPTAE